MTTTTVPGPVAKPDEPTEQKKKARPNPARRKAARTRSDAEHATPSVPAGPPSGRPQLRRVVTIESIRGELSASQSNPGPPRPTPMPRQKTEPRPVPRERAPSVPKQPPPKLLRAVTAPPAAKQAGTLALKGPALVTGGLVGCAAGAAVLLGVQLWYDFAGPESAIMAAKSARLSVNNLSEELVTSLKSGTYSADEALDVLRRTTLAYASTIPDGSSFVERIFLELDTVRRQRGREVDRVVAEMYTELARAGKQGANSVEMRDVVIKQLMKLSSFANNATRDVVARNPKLRPFTEEAARSLKGPSETGTPTVRVNMAVRQKQQSIKQ